MKEKIKELARFIHNTYEEISREVGWKTQTDCRVTFDELPTKNKIVMIRIAKTLYKRGLR